MSIESTKKESQIKIGIEVHITLNSKKKVFNLNQIFNDNEEKINNVESWELGYLGTLPILNSEIINLAIKLCLFFKMKINKEIIFDRKIYSYFDLSKGFQITQQRSPIGENGIFSIIYNEEEIDIPIKRIQIEEDTAKSSYENHKVYLDFNRAGNPLLELVTDPVFEDVEILISFIKQLQNLLIYLEISNAKMEKGQFRIDLNFSFKFSDSYTTPRYEVKNLNSLNNLKKSIEQEFEKHLKIFSENRKCSLESETLNFNEKFQKTEVQRQKTNYFYLPEINIPIINLRDEDIEKIFVNLPVPPSLIWKEISALNLKNSINLLTEKPFILKIINFLIYKNIEYREVFEDFYKFYFNIIIASLSNLNEMQIFDYFKSNFEHFWRTFLYWKNKSISNAEAKSFISLLYSNIDKFLQLETEETNEKKVFISSETIEKEIPKILEETKINEKTLSQSTKLSNFIFGQLKIKFPNQEIKPDEVKKSVEKFLKK